VVIWYMTTQKETNVPEKLGTCFKCGRSGHFIANCPENKQTERYSRENWRLKNQNERYDRRDDGYATERRRDDFTSRGRDAYSKEREDFRPARLREERRKYQSSDDENVYSHESNRKYQKEIKCFNCFEKGHLSTQCTKEKKIWHLDESQIREIVLDVVQHFNGIAMMTTRKKVGINKWQVKKMMSRKIVESSH